MAFTIRNEVKTGILGVIALALFVLGFNYLKGSGLLSSSKTFYATFDDAQGLTPSSFVMQRGVQIGSVRNIYLSKKEPGKVEVEFSLKKEINIPKDSKANIMSAGLLSPVALNIMPGTSTTSYAGGEYIATEKYVGMIDKLSENAEPIMKNLDGTMANAKTAITTIDNTVSNINSLIDAQTKANLQQSIARLNKTTADFNTLSSSLASQREKISSTVSSLEKFASNLNSNNQNINATLANIKSTTDQINKADLTGTINNLKNTLAQLDATIANVNSDKGTVGMLLNDKKLYNDLQGSLHSLDALLADLKANPGRYLSVSVFGKKQK
jgi:phospholipid/cholesterol/gamma-HCH transport system substrate-binding protein